MLCISLAELFLYCSCIEEFKFKSVDFTFSLQLTPYFFSAAIDNNFNVGREQAQTKEGVDRYKIKIARRPKFSTVYCTSFLCSL